MREAAAQREQGHLGIAANYACAIRSLSLYLSSVGRDRLPFSLVTARLMLSYEHWLQQRGVCRNTSSCYLRSLRTIFNRAVRQGCAQGNPFAEVYTGVAKTRKRAVTMEDIRRIYRLNVREALLLHGENPFRKSFARQLRRLELCRDLFIFCFCARGLTFVDLAYLKKSDVTGSLFTYYRKKTGQFLEVRIEPLMQAIINRHKAAETVYLFPILTSTDALTAYRQYRSALRTYNQGLHQLSSLLGNGLFLTSYVSRHTWATAAYHQDMPLSLISQALGHDSERTTQIYLKSLESSRIDKANHTLLNTIFKKSTSA